MRICSVFVISLFRIVCIVSNKILIVIIQVTFLNNAYSLVSSCEFQLIIKYLKNTYIFISQCVWKTSNSTNTDVFCGVNAVKDRWTKELK